MSKFSQAFGKNYEKNRVSILSRSFEMGNHTFKVRVPSVGELEAIYNFEISPDHEWVEDEYKRIVANLKVGDDGVNHVENDVIVQGRSMREAAQTKIALMHRITEYFKLLVPENGESLNDLTYADIEAEFPLGIQMQFVEKITEVISPDYKEARGK